MPLTSAEFEALKRWIGSRSAIAVELKNREFDQPFVEARKRDLAAADGAAQTALVTSENYANEVTDDTADVEVEEAEVEDTQP